MKTIPPILLMFGGVLTLNLGLRMVQKAMKDEGDVGFAVTIMFMSAFCSTVQLIAAYLMI